ncbi:MAG: glycosyltransferase [Bacteroidaceae bacterium]|nr:glycosyltransferase [Bacteroidaceae bacterium]
MKILLVGEYSNVHWTLAQGLRALGHEVTVVSDGDRWKNYPRDIDLRRRAMDSSSRLERTGGSIRYLFDLARVWPTLRGYDVVQLINPVFIDLKAERLWPFYRYLRKHNGRVFLGAFGIDYYWVKVGSDCKTFRYSDFNFGSQLRNYPFMQTMIKDWLHGPKGILNQRIAEDCDGIITGLYEYECCYRPYYPEKTRFIPFPIDRSSVSPVTLYSATTAEPLHFFIGVQSNRSYYKGTDIMLSALQRLKKDYPESMEVVKAENLPFNVYQERMNSSHVLLDQLYSYTPAMNALMAMAKGLIVVGGGEPEQYELLGEHQLRPIINVQPTEEDVYEQIATRLLSGQEDIRQLQLDSMEYIRRHHDHFSVARKYEEFYGMNLN